MKIMLTTIVIIVAVAAAAAAAAAAGATTAATTIEIFAQNERSPMDQLINDCMYNNVTACNALEHYNSTTYPAIGLNTTTS
jgi:opacity protein-like surface antigen